MRSTRSTRVVAAAAAGLVLAACGSTGASGGSSSAASSAASSATESGGAASSPALTGIIKVGLVAPLTGNLAAFGEPDQWVADQMTAWFAQHPIVSGDKTFGVQIIVKDSQSDPKRAGEVAGDLINTDGVDVLMAVAAPETTLPVTAQCEANAVPCLTSITPWQPWFFGSGGKPDAPLKWSHHVFWGLEDVTAVFQDMWGQVPTNKVVAGLFPNDSDGTAWAAEVPKMIEPNGYKLVNPGAFPVDTQDFSAQIAAFKQAKAEILIGVMPPPTFMMFWQQAQQQGYRPKVVTVGKALEFPSAVTAMGDAATNLGTEVWWSPTYPTKSSLTGESSADYAASYTKATGKQWSMPLPFPEVLFEVLNAAVIKAGSSDKQAINEALTGLKVSTLVGDVDWGKGPTPNVAKSLVTGGQWRKAQGGQFPFDLTIVSNSIAPSVPTAGKLEPLS